MATHSSTLAWRIPWTEEWDRLQSMESPKIGHNCATNFHFYDLLLSLIYNFMAYQLLSNSLVYLCLQPLKTLKPNLHLFSSLANKILLYANTYQNGKLKHLMGVRETVGEGEEGKEGKRKVGRQRWRMEGSVGSKTKNNRCLLTKGRKALGSLVLLPPPHFPGYQLCTSHISPQQQSPVWQQPTM